jgi:Tudor domain
MILVSYKGTWQRALVLDLDESQVAVALVDTLISTVVPLEDVRKIPKVFALQIFTQLCHVDDGKDFNFSKMREMTEAGNVTVNVQINSEDQHPILKFNVYD